MYMQVPMSPYTQVWVTADKQGLKSGTYFWPGSDVLIEGKGTCYCTLYSAAAVHTCM